MLQNGLILLWFIILIIVFHKQYKKGCMPSDPYLKIVVTKVNKIFTQNKTFYGELDILNSNRDLLKRIPVIPSNRSYTVNKKIVHVCVKKDDGTYYDQNTVIYVLIHELAHVLCTEYGHTENYYKIFDELLEEAIRLDIYNPNQNIDTTYPVME